MGTQMMCKKTYAKMSSFAAMNVSKLAEQIQMTLNLRRRSCKHARRTNDLKFEFGPLRVQCTSTSLGSGDSKQSTQTIGLAWVDCRAAGWQNKELETVAQLLHTLRIPSGK